MKGNEDTSLICLFRERYLRDQLSVRLGGLAANLARIRSFSDHPDHRDVVESLLEESKFFIEWTVPDAELDVQTVFVELQLQEGDNNHHEELHRNI